MMTINDTISDFNADYANMKVNSKTFGFKINGVEVETDGTVIANSATENVIASTIKETRRIIKREFPKLYR